MRDAMALLPFELSLAFKRCVENAVLLDASGG